MFRARVANPRWIASMIRHGYKGAAELSATVDYLFGYDATTGVAEDWMYEQVAAALPARRRRRRVHGALEPVGRRGRSPSGCSRPPTAGCGPSPPDATLDGDPRPLPGARGRARGGRRVTPRYPAERDRRPGGARRGAARQRRRARGRRRARARRARHGEVDRGARRWRRCCRRSRAADGQALRVRARASARPAGRSRPTRAVARAARAARRAAARRDARPARRRAGPRPRAGRRAGVRARPAGPRPPRDPLRRRGQPAARPPRRRAARRRRLRASRGWSATPCRSSTTRASCWSGR